MSFVFGIAKCEMRGVNAWYGCSGDDLDLLLVMKVWWWWHSSQVWVGNFYWRISGAKLVVEIKLIVLTGYYRFCRIENMRYNNF